MREAIPGPRDNHRVAAPDPAGSDRASKAAEVLGWSVDPLHRKPEQLGEHFAVDVHALEIVEQAGPVVPGRVAGSLDDVIGEARRLRNVFASLERKLFVCVTLREMYSPTAFDKIYASLARRTTRFDLLCMVVDAPNPDAIVPAVDALPGAAGQRTFLIRPVSSWAG